MIQQSNNNDLNSRVQDEIDLLFVYNKIKGFFIRGANGIMNIFIAIIKNWLLISFITLLGASAGIGLFFNSKPVYTSTMILSSDVVRNDFCADQLSDLNLYIQDNTPDLLAKTLKIDLPSARQIRKIEFINYDENIKEKYDKKDTIVLGLPFKVKVFSNSNTIFDTMQSALINHLENNAYALKKKKIKKNNLSQLHNQLNVEMVQLDSLKAAIEKNLLPRGNVSGFVFGEPIDPINIYKAQMELFKEDLKLAEQMEMVDNIQVIDGFSPRGKPDSPKLFKMVILGAFVGFLFGFIIVLFLGRRKTKLS